MTRRATPLGFTLMEVMVAIAITALIGGTLAAALTSGVNAKETIEADAEHYRTLRASMSRMVREIGAAYVSDRYDIKRYRDQNERPTNFIGQKNHLLFTSLAHQRLYTDAKESDQMVVEYSVKPSADKGARGRQDLFRRENPNLQDRMDRGGNEEVLLEGVKRLEFAYWDSDKKEWLDDWDTRRLERKSTLPTRVRLTVVALDETGKEARYVTQARIALNTEFSRF